MRRYDETVDVRRGLVSGQEAPTQFLWRNRLWVVREIIAHWIETGAWWERPGVGVLFGITDGTDVGTDGTYVGSDGTGVGTLSTSRPGGFEAAIVSREAEEGSQPRGGPAASNGDLLEEREVWRVEARCARTSAGVFDLSFDWALGQWRLVCCVD